MPEEEVKEHERAVGLVVLRGAHNVEHSVCVNSLKAGNFTVSVFRGEALRQAEVEGKEDVALERAVIQGLV